MSDWAQKYKPAASTRVHVMVAALMWTAVGTGLAAAGLYWSSSVGWPKVLLLVLPAAAVGILKARLVLGKTARRITDRICRRGEGRCLGGFISWRMWLLVLFMMLMGRALRSGPLPQAILSFVYLAVGVALLTGAIRLWRAYSAIPRQA